ncbi:MAG: hypothetical protein H0T42_08580 [Deltaproteobacteria bacterium]|nr:hypothetical protein [Deltaproteobacteria bacterium]
MRSLFLTLLIAIPTTSMAQPSKAPDVTSMATDDCARARKAGKTCVLTIGEEDIEGKNPTLTETKIDVLVIGKMSSLIRLRRDFIPEILKSAEDID